MTIVQPFAGAPPVRVEDPPSPAPVYAPTPAPAPHPVFIVAPWVFTALGIAIIIDGVVAQTLHTFPQTGGVLLAGTIVTAIGSILVAVQAYLMHQAAQAQADREYDAAEHRADLDHEYRLALVKGG